MVPIVRLINSAAEVSSDPVQTLEFLRVGLSVRGIDATVYQNTSLDSLATLFTNSFGSDFRADAWIDVSEVFAVDPDRAMLDQQELQAVAVRNPGTVFLTFYLKDGKPKSDRQRSIETNSDSENCSTFFISSVEDIAIRTISDRLASQGSDEFRTHIQLIASLEC